MLDGRHQKPHKWRAEGDQKQNDQRSQQEADVLPRGRVQESDPLRFAEEPIPIRHHMMFKRHVLAVVE
jgi:hypothetical protein